MHTVSSSGSRTCHMYALVCMYFMCTRICRSFTLHDAPLRHPVPTYVHARICTCMYVHIGMYAHIGMYVQMCTHTLKLCHLVVRHSIIWFAIVRVLSLCIRHEHG